MLCAPITLSHVVSFHPCLKVLCPLPNQTLSICEPCEVLFARDQIPHLVMILLALGISVEYALRCFHLALGWCCFPLAGLTIAIFPWQPACSWQCHTVLDWRRANRCQCFFLAEWCLHTWGSSICGCGYCGCSWQANRVQQTHWKKKHANTLGEELWIQSVECMKWIHRIIRLLFLRMYNVQVHMQWL